MVPGTLRWPARACGPTNGKVRAGGAARECLSGPDFPFVPEPERVLTDASGAFEIATLLPGTDYAVVATADGFEGRTGVAVGAGEVAVVDLHLAPEVPSTRWWLEVEVRERATGHPVAGAHVRRQVTDGAGFVRVALESSGDVGVVADGYFRATVEVEPPDDLSGPAPTRRVVVLLDPTVSIRGTVVDPDGQPAEGARVTVGKPPAEEDYWRFDYERTDRGGRFVFQGREPGGAAVLLSATWEHEGRRFAGEAPATPGQEDVRIHLVIQPCDPALLPRRIAVRGADGLAVAHARALLLAVERSAPGDRPDDGERREDWASVEDSALRVAPTWAPFHLHVHDARDEAGLPLPLGAVLLGPFGSTADLPAEIVLPPARRIEGRVSDQAGAPVPGLVVEAFARLLPAPLPGRQRWTTSHGRARTGADGGFVFDRLGDFEYRVHVGTPPSWADAEDLFVRPGCPPLEVRLERTVSVSCVVTVLDPRGDPLPGAEVVAEIADDGQLAYFDPPQYRTASDGRCRLEGLSASSTYELTVTPDRRRHDLAPETIHDWTAEDTVVRLAATVSVEGVVVDPAGRGIQGAFVQLSLRVGRPHRRGGPLRRPVGPAGSCPTRGRSRPVPARHDLRRGRALRAPAPRDRAGTRGRGRPRRSSARKPEARRPPGRHPGWRPGCRVHDLRPGVRRRPPAPGAPRAGPGVRRC